METIAEYNGLRIPTWALSYLVNADDSEITEEEKKMVDDYMRRYERFAEENNAHIIFSIETNFEDYEKAEQRLIELIDSELEENEFGEFGDVSSLVHYSDYRDFFYLKDIKDEYKEPYFTWGPEFGLGCDVQECTILIVK